MHYLVAICVRRKKRTGFVHNCTLPLLYTLYLFTVYGLSHLIIYTHACTNNTCMQSCLQVCIPSSCLLESSGDGYQTV